MVGVGLGYLVRLLILLLTEADKPVPLAGLGGGAPPVAWVKWVREHYYLVDGSVMLLLGYLVLVYMAKNNLAPDVAVSGPHCLVYGATLGLLTNTRLLTQLPK